MSEEKRSFMEELDLWTEANVIGPLWTTAPDSRHEESLPEWEKAVESVKKAIRTKVLDSYHNGQAAGPSKPRGAYKPRGK